MSRYKLILGALAVWAWTLIAVSAGQAAGTQGASTAAASASARASMRAVLPATPVQWRGVFKGIDCAAETAAGGLPQVVHALRVDLSDPNIQFFVTPSNGDAPLDTNGLKTSTFLKQYKVQAAINASPFDPVIEDEQTPQNVQGLSVSNGDAYSPSEKGRPALVISADNKARIVEHPVDANGVYNAVAGFSIILKKGQNLCRDDVRHPRTAVGISADGRYLYLIVIDGRQAGYSEGATTAETAEWLRRYGASEGLNLDGGGSSAMVISDGRGGATVLNRPIHRGIPGTERVNANHLGVFACPLQAASSPATQSAER